MWLNYLSIAWVTAILLCLIDAYQSTVIIPVDEEMRKEQEAKQQEEMEMSELTIDDFIN